MCAGEMQTNMVPHDPHMFPMVEEAKPGRNAIDTQTGKASDMQGTEY